MLAAAMAITAALLSCAAQSCRLFHMVPVTIPTWSPSKKSVDLDEDDDITISVTFSAQMDKTSAEEAFSLTRDGDTVAGSYSWETKDENTLVFTPHVPIEPDSEYEIAVGTSAEDIYGNNLSVDFIHTFYTGDDRDRPEIESIRPRDGSSTDRVRQPVVITFSEPIDRASFYEGFDIIPAVEGSYAWNGENSKVTFTPNRDLTLQRWYTVTVESTVEDAHGNELGETVIAAFYTGTDTVPPRIVRAENGEGTVELVPGPGTGLVITEGWETDWNIRLVFSEPVLVSGIEESVVVDPPTDFEVEWPGPAGEQAVLEVVITFDERPAFDELYTLSIKTGSEGSIVDCSGNALAGPEDDPGVAYIYWFQTNGPGSKPPEVTRVVFLEDPGGSPPPPDPVTVTCEQFDMVDLSAYNQAGGRIGYFDLYVSLAEGAEVDYISFIENFSLTATNGCADIDILAAETGPYTGGPPDPPAGDGEQVIRIHTRIREHPENGLVALRIGDGFSDSGGNLITDTWLFYLHDHTP